MTNDKNFKKLIRDRMSITGETYTVARRKLQHRQQALKVQKQFTLQELITDPIEYQQIIDALNKPGLILITGLTGTGKTTLQKALIQEQLTRNQPVTQIDVNFQEILFNNQPNYINKTVLDDPETINQAFLSTETKTIGFSEIRHETNIAAMQTKINTNTIISTIHSPSALNALNKINYMVKYNRNDNLEPEKQKLVEDITYNINLIIHVQRLDKIVENLTTESPLYGKGLYEVYPIKGNINEKLYSNKNVIQVMEERFKQLQIKTIDQKLEELVKDGILKEETRNIKFYKE